MITGKKYYFFRLECVSDSHIEYRIAESFDDLYMRFGSDYLSSYCNITKFHEVTIEHIEAISLFLLQETFS